MLALEVYIDGRKVCTAGVGTYGVLTSMVTWVRRDGDMRFAPPDEAAPPEGELGATVSGLATDSTGASVHVKWLDRPLAVGSEVVVRVVEAGEASSPVSSYRDDPAFVDQRQREYYERLKRE